MKMLMVTMVVLVGLLSGCIYSAPNVQYIQRIPFPEEEYSKLPKMGTGSATIKGQVFLLDKSGQRRYGSQPDVLLGPVLGTTKRSDVLLAAVTSYSKQIYDVMGNVEFSTWTVSIPKFSPGDLRCLAYQTFVIADEIGRFEFNNVPPGQYYLGSAVMWWYYFLSPMGGGTVTKVITIEEGKEYNIILTR